MSWNQWMRLPWPRAMRRNRRTVSSSQPMFLSGPVSQNVPTYEVRVEVPPS
jgi:hypothetical protein